MSGYDEIEARERFDRNVSEIARQIERRDDEIGELRLALRNANERIGQLRVELEDWGINVEQRLTAELEQARQRIARLESDLIRTEGELAKMGNERTR